MKLELKILVEVSNKDWQKSEIEFIKHYKRFCKLTNTTEGGECGPTDLETRKKISNSLKKSQKGKKLSESHKLKISRAMIGNKILWGDKISKGLKKFNQTEKGKTIIKNKIDKMKLLNTGKKLSEGHKNKISKALFEFYKNNIHYCTGKTGKLCSNSKKIIQISKDTNKSIKTWDSQRDAAKELGLHQALISKCCLGHRGTTGGFKWKYAGDEVC